MLLNTLRWGGVAVGNKSLSCGVYVDTLAVRLGHDVLDVRHLAKNNRLRPSVHLVAAFNVNPVLDRLLARGCGTGCILTCTKAYRKNSSSNVDSELHKGFHTTLNIPITLSR